MKIDSFGREKGRAPCSFIFSQNVDLNYLKLWIRLVFEKMMIWRRNLWLLICHKQIVLWKIWSDFNLIIGLMEKKHTDTWWLKNVENNSRSVKFENFRWRNLKNKLQFGQNILKILDQMVTFIHSFWRHQNDNFYKRPVFDSLNKLLEFFFFRRLHTRREIGSPGGQNDEPGETDWKRKLNAQNSSNPWRNVINLYFSVHCQHIFNFDWFLDFFKIAKQKSNEYRTKTCNRRTVFFSDCWKRNTDEISKSVTTGEMI